MQKYQKLLLTSSLILVTLSGKAFSDKEQIDESLEISSIGVYSKLQMMSPGQKNSLKEDKKKDDLIDVKSTSGSKTKVGGDFSNNIEIPESNLLIPSQLGKVSVSYQNNEFYIQEGSSKIFQVQRWNLSRELRGIKEDKLTRFLSVGYLSVKKVGDDYLLDANTRLLGGGFLAAVIAGVGTSALMVGAAVTGNVPTVIGLAYSAPAIIGGALVLPTL